MNSATQDLSLTQPNRQLRSRIDAFDLFCILALVLSFVVVSRLPVAPSKFGDLYFHEEAQILSQAVRGARPWSDVAFTRAPGPSLYYALPYSLVKPNSPEEVYWRAAFAWNCGWIVLAVLLIRRTAELLCNPLAGKIAALLVLLLPFPLYYSFGVSAEGPAYVSASVFVYGWIRSRTTRSPQSPVLGVFISLAGLIALILCRPNAIVILGIAVLCGAILWKYRSIRESPDWRFALLCAATGLACLLLTSLVLKYIPSRRGVNSQTSNFIYVMLQGSFQYRTEPWDWRPWDKRSRIGSADYQHWAEVHQELLNQASRGGESFSHLESAWLVSDILHHPLRRVQMFAVRLLSLNIWTVGSQSPRAFHLGPFRGLSIYLAFHIALNALVLLCLLAALSFLAGNREAFLAYWPLWGLWGGLLIFHALTYAESRYMLPAQPGLTIMAGCFIAARIEKRKTQTHSFSDEVQVQG
jgi:hypothetical protein